MIEMFRLQKFAYKNRSILCCKFYPFSFFLTVNCLTCTWCIFTSLSIWTWVLNHDKYVEIKQFSKDNIKLNIISTVILLIKFLVYQEDPRHLQGSRVVYIFVYIVKFVFYLISNHIFVCINHKDTCKSDSKWCAQRIIEFTDEKLKQKVQIEDRFIYIMNESVRSHFKSVFDLQINNSITYLLYTHFLK